ncbi:MAG: c-type cytochrome [Alphaproteobacteria bacterium]|nr:c-type cytochrome [Alphaproteobacteria bacterium]
MRKMIAASVLALLPIGALAADAPPEWAYPAMPQGYVPPAEPEVAQRVTGSQKTYTPKEIGNQFAPPDWFPNQHPAQPAIVARGKAPEVNACSQCHLSSGSGHPESANIAGLPAAYIFEQLQEFKNGNRTSMLPGRSNNMVRFAKNMTDEEMKQAADYFSAIKPIVWNKVIETDTVGKSFVGEGNMRFISAGNDKEPIGKRIIEVPEDEHGAKKRDPHSPFVAYVPRGSIEAGSTLAKTGGNGKTIQCGVCHGPDFKGLGNVPPLAGRSPIYLYRQLNDIQHGTRKGNAIALMQPVVQKLTSDDMIALAAYMGSLTP